MHCQIPLSDSRMSHQANTKAISVSESFAQWATVLTVDGIPDKVRSTAKNAVLDFMGLCFAARQSDYVRALIASWDGVGDCTAIGHAESFDAAGAAVINGTAAHGEDYDDTFEGTPVHTGAVVIPAVLATCQRHGRSGQDALLGMVAGSELMCRMALVAPTAMHRAGFHPTAVIGAFGATAGVGVAMGLSAAQLTNALGIAGSLASGIIEYLAEGAWTKRLHGGWAAQCGLRAASLGQNDFLGPRTVLEGEHGFFFAFGVDSIEPDFELITRDLGQQWWMERIAFKPYACGTMAQPFIDAAIKLVKQGIDPLDISNIRCKVGEGTVHRLWEPLSEKHNPSTSYSAKFSVPYCIAVAFFDQAAGLGQFTEARVRDAQVRELASKINYEIDPANEYPRNYTGHVRVTLRDGSVHEAEQPHLRGGVREPLTSQELLDKFFANVEFGGLNQAQGKSIESYCRTLFEQPDLTGMTGLRNC